MERERTTTWWEGLAHMAEHLIQPIVGMLMNTSDELSDLKSTQRND